MKVFIWLINLFNLLCRSIKCGVVRTFKIDISSLVSITLPFCGTLEGWALLKRLMTTFGFICDRSLEEEEQQQKKEEADKK